MTDVVSRLHTAAAGLTRAIDAAESRVAWDVDSPCEGWTAGDVADHIIDNYLVVVSTLGIDVKRTGDRPQDWVAVRDAVLSAAGRDGALDTVVDGPDGQTPLGRLLAVYVEVDTLLHTWDIAHAVGAEESLDEELCRRCYERFLPADERIRAPGAFGPKLDYTEDDPIQVKTLRFFRHGELPLVILAVLAARRSNGWGVVRAIEDLFDGAYQPSPGAVYPALDALAAEGLVAAESDETRQYSVTDLGRRALDERREQLARIELRTRVQLSPSSQVDAALERLAVTARRVARHDGTDEVTRLLERACRQLVRLSSQERACHARRNLPKPGIDRSSEVTRCATSPYSSTASSRAP